MALKLYSAARAALTGGDGMFDIGDREPPAIVDDFTRAFLAAFTDAMGLTYEEFAEGYRRTWDSMFDAWLRGHLGYDPQRLLVAP